jgi:Resolvase, N terminal domain
MIYGYARVSTGGQSVAAQVAGFRAAGAGKVFWEVASGAKTDRAQLRKAIAALQAGDVLMVTRLDRLARSTRWPGGPRCAADHPGRRASRRQAAARRAGGQLPDQACSGHLGARGSI